jgi:pimeloyl-ACP methyl ester carboxylesterase
VRAEKGGEKMKKKILVFSLLFSLVITLIPATISMVLTASAASPYTEITSTLNGANYLIRIPNPVETWNRNLVVYCHGYSHTEPQPPLNAATGGADAFIAGGTAFAMSSYGMGGYFIQTAINNTYLLTQYVKTTYNVTGKIFLFGISQGGGVSLQLAEKYPNLYSGVLDISGSKDLKISYRTRIDQLSAKNDTELAAKLQALGASVPPYPFPTLTSLQSFNTNQRDDMENATGGTPDTVPKAYEDISASYHANISIPVITVHALGDPVNTYTQALAYQAAVAAAGKSRFYRLYSTNGTGHVDSSVTSQIPIRFAELASWSSTLQDWNMTVNGGSMKAYPELKEYVWQKNASMAPNGPYDKIGLHRLVKTGTALKGVIFVVGCPMWGMGEQRISNPTTDNWTKTENYSSPIYWANRGYDVYAIDYRTNFVPKTLNASQMAFAANWGLDVWVSDTKEAADKVKEVSGASKFFISGECSGGEAVLNYAAKYWKDDLRGIILLDANFPGVNGYPIVGKTAETNTYNMTKAIADMNAAGAFAGDTFRTLRSVASYALQNPGAPAAYPPGTPLNPPLNPITNNTWANITEWFTFMVQNSFGSTTIPPGAFSNLTGGYGNISQVEYCFANNQFLPSRLTIETTAMADWANCPYLTYDYNDHYSEIGVPVLAYAGPYVNQTGAFRFISGINNTDFTGNYMPMYGHLDIFFGTYSARDVSEPAYQWMVSHYPPLIASVTPASTSITKGQDVTLTVSVSGGTKPYTYQWFEQGSPLAGQTFASMYIIKTAAGSFTYYCRVTDSEAATINSSTATIEVTQPQISTPTPLPTPKPATPNPTLTNTPSPTVNPTPTPVATNAPSPNPEAQSILIPVAIYGAAAAIAILAITAIVLVLRKSGKVKSKEP